MERCPSAERESETVIAADKSERSVERKERVKDRSDGISRSGHEPSTVPVCNAKLGKYFKGGRRGRRVSAL